MTICHYSPWAMARTGDICYPWGNRARAEILRLGMDKAMVEFLDDSIADFGWYQYLIIERGAVLTIRRDQLFDGPRELGGS